MLTGSKLLNMHTALALLIGVFATLLRGLRTILIVLLAFPSGMGRHAMMNVQKTLEKSDGSRRLKSHCQTMALMVSPKRAAIPPPIGLVGLLFLVITAAGLDHNSKRRKTLISEAGLERKMTLDILFLCGIGSRTSSI